MLCAKKLLKEFLESFLSAAGEVFLVPVTNASESPVGSGDNGDVSASILQSKTRCQTNNI